MPHSPCQFSSCTPAIQAAAVTSRRCPLISHYPLCFKSIVNYLQKNTVSSHPAREVDITGQAYICLGVTLGEDCPPTTCYLSAHQCSSQEPAFRFALCGHFVSLRHTIFISQADADTHAHSETQILMQQFLSICTSLAKNPVFNKRLHLWWGEGQANGEICPHVLNLGEALIH